MKQGFVIARSSDRDQFFTSRSSYQHPEWIKLDEATVYHTAEIAQSAVKKMWLSGNLTARIVPLAEMEIQFVKPEADPQDSVAADETPITDPNDASSEEFCDACDHPAEECVCDVEKEPCPVCGDGPCRCDGDTEDADKVGQLVVVTRDPMAVKRDGVAEAKLDEVSKAKLDAYMSSSKVREQEALARGEVPKDRSEGRKLALKKTWGNSKYGLTEPKVKATPVVEDDGQAFSRARFLPDQKVKYNKDPSKSFYVVQDSGTGVVQIRERGDDTSDPLSVDTSTLVKESQFSLLPKDEAPNVRAAVARSEERKYQQQHDGEPTGWIVKDASGKQYGSKFMSQAGAKTFAIQNPAARKAGAKVKPVFEAEFKMPAKPPLDAQQDDKNPQIIPNLKIKVDDLKLKDPTVIDQKDPDTKLTHATAEPHADKVKVPASVKAQLSDAIAKFKKDVDFNNGRNDAQASFAMTCQSAMEELRDLLDIGTVESIKMAQVKLTSFMNPITTNIPAEVRDFIYRGGMKPSIKDLFDIKKAQQETK